VNRTLQQHGKPSGEQFMTKILYVINPAAFGGQGSDVWDRFQSQWPYRLDPQDILITKRAGDAREIAASSKGYDVLAAVGGDGTAGEILSGILEHQESRPKLAIIPGGTGNDIARNAGIFSVEDAVAALRGNHTRTFDLFRVDCHVDGRAAHRYAFLGGNVGLSARAFSMLKPWMKRFLGPKGAYYLCMVLGIIAYRPRHMTARWADQAYSGRTWTIIVGNVERAAGGSMCIAPGARTDDGELNVTIVTSQSKMKILRKMPKIATGSHVDEPFVSYFPVKKIDVDSDPPAGLEIDGDIFGTTPATFTVCPRAVQILSPESSKNKTV